MASSSPPAKTPALPDDQFHRITKALADARRFHILERIAHGCEVACAVLASELPVSQATISHHLKELTSAGLLESRRQAKFMYFSLRSDIWSAYIHELSRRVPPFSKSR